MVGGGQGKTINNHIVVYDPSMCHNLVQNFLHFLVEEEAITMYQDINGYSDLPFHIAHRTDSAPCALPSMSNHAIVALGNSVLVFGGTSKKRNKYQQRYYYGDQLFNRTAGNEF